MTRRTNRSAATLIELLVVIGIMVVLMGLAAMILPSLRTSNNAAKAASIISGQLSIAKQRALRDQEQGRGRGIRLIRDASDPNLVREIQFVEQPEIPDIKGVAPTVTLSAAVAQLSGSDLTWVGYGVEPGDLLLIDDGSRTIPYKIGNINPANEYQVAIAQLSNIPATPTSYAKTAFRIVRKPRPLLGEPNIQLPPHMVIDLAKSLPVPSATAPWNTLGDQLDIIFQPGGELANAPVGKLILFVRHEEIDNGSEPTLVCIYASTGAIILHEVSPNPTNPYEYVSDGKGSGL